MDLEKEFEKALEIINNLVDNLMFLPYHQDGEKFFDVSDDTKEFLEKHSPRLAKRRNILK